jgi:hypothetical protein
MLGWFRNKEVAPHMTREEQEEFNRLLNAVMELGEQSGEEIKAHFKLVKDAYLRILDERLTYAVTQKEVPALAAGRAEYSVFCEYYDELKEKLKVQIVEHEGEWIKLANQLNLGELAAKRIEATLDMFMADLKQSASELRDSYAERINKAHAAWRP